MVAYTSPDCLPYFECTDPLCLNTGSVCEPSTVWCDFATIVDQRLTDLDDLVTRTATSPPMAFVQTSVPFTHQVANINGTEVPFTESVVDTDNMVDLTLNPLGFTIHTPGLYEFVVYLFGLTATSGSDLTIQTTLNLSPSNPGINGVFANSLSMGYQASIDDILVTPQIHFMLPVFAEQVATVLITTGGTVGDSVTFSYAMMAATWMADLPL